MITVYGLGQDTSVNLWEQAKAQQKPWYVSTQPVYVSTQPLPPTHEATLAPIPAGTRPGLLDRVKGWHLVVVGVGAYWLWALSKRK